MSEIKTIDKLPRSLLIKLAIEFGFREYMITDEVSDYCLADFISRSI